MAEKKKDIPKEYKTLAKDECASWSNHKCMHDNKVCNLEENEPCGYFNKAVFPLLSQKK